MNFGKASKLSTAEALAAALYIAGFKDEAQRLLSIFTWGHTFFELNVTHLEDYVKAKNSLDIIKTMRSKFKTSGT